MHNTTACCCKAAFHIHYSFSIYRCCFICVFVLLISTGSPHIIIEGVEGKSITLPCSHTSFKLTSKDLVVHWRHNDIINVYDIIHGRVSVQEQDSVYKNRASVKPEECMTGDCSLTLTNLQLSDGGMYLCYIPTMGVFQNAQLIVKGGFASTTKPFREHRVAHFRSNGTETRPSLIPILLFLCSFCTFLSYFM